MAADPELISLYLHLPFCDHICGYCDFYTVYRRPERPVHQRFSRALIREIEMRGQAQEAGVATIYLGGGTPSLLGATQIAEIGAAIGSHFATDALSEFSIEINPGTIDLEDLKRYRETGINRPSFGIQSFHDLVLKQADRIHTAEEAAQAIEWAHQAGFENISLDLMYGIPGQEKRHWRQSLKQAIALDVQHISVYNLTYEAGTPFFRRKETGQLVPAPEDLEYWFFETTLDILESQGFIQYETSNFAQPGFECRHNMAYWNHRPYLGLGPSAHSFDGVSRAWNDNNLRRYLSQLEGGSLPPAQRETLDPIMQLEERLILGLRQTRGVAISDFETLFGLSLSDWPRGLSQHFGDDWQKWIDFDGRRLALTRTGAWMSDALLPIFCAWLQKEIA